MIFVFSEKRRSAIILILLKRLTSFLSEDSNRAAKLNTFHSPPPVRDISANSKNI